MEENQTILDLVEKVAVEQKYVDYTVNIERDLDNAYFMSALYNVKLSAPEKPDLTFFAKVAAMNEKLRKAAAFSPYGYELYFYSKLSKCYEKLEEKYDLPENQRIRIPKQYGLRDDYLKETLLLEHLNGDGFQDFDRTKSADMEYVCAGIDLMAKFHALSVAYHRDDPEGFRQTCETLGNNELLEVFLLSTEDKVVTNALAAVEGEHKTKLQKYFQKPDSYRQIMDNYRYHGRNILVHGDFKPSNLMYRRRNGELELAILDFQMVHDGDPAVELLYFIFTGTDEQFRRAHYHEMLDLYYERLRVALRNLRLEPEETYPEKVYWMKLEECKMLGLVMAVVMLPVILVENSKAPEFDKEDSNLSDIATEGSALFKERFNGVINNFVEWGLL